MKVSVLLVDDAEVYAPEALGRLSVLAVGNRIAAMDQGLEVPSWGESTVIHARGAMMVPGLVDQHVHIAGGGGEGGPQNRTPAIQLSQLTTAGITTVVGLLGTDGTTRSVQELLARARALEVEGISAWIYSGAYDVPTRTATQSARSDIILLDRVLGIGEVALSDQRGSHPSLQQIAELASEARVGGLLAHKAGVVHLHLGSGKRCLTPLMEVLDLHDIPIQTFVPTHLNRTRALLKSAAVYGRRGGWLDITSGIGGAEERDPEAVDPAEALFRLAQQGVPWDQLSLSSDAQGSAPVFDPQGELTHLGVGKADTLWPVIVDLVTRFGLPWEQALRPVTSTPATILKLPAAGRIQVGGPADFLLIGDHRIDTVVAKGRVMVEKGRPRVWGTFEARA